MKPLRDRMSLFQFLVKPGHGMLFYENLADLRGHLRVSLMKLLPQGFNLRGASSPRQREKLRCAVIGHALKGKGDLADFVEFLGQQGFGAFIELFKPAFIVAVPLSA